MGGNKLLLIGGGVVVLVLLVVVGVGGFLYLRGSGSEPEEVIVETPTIAPPEYTQIVVAVQDIPRGMQISRENNAVALKEWPNDFLPIGYLTSLEEIEGKLARMEIPRGIPVMMNMLGQPGGMLSVSGSPAALFAPEERVAYVLPMDVQGGVAWAIRPGDHVDVITSFYMQPVDPEFQTLLPNNFLLFMENDEGETTFTSDTYGRFETFQTGDPAIVFPSGPAIQNVVVQLTVQDAIVWHLGVWKDEDISPTASGGTSTTTTPASVETTPEPTEEATAAPEEGGGGGLLSSPGGAAATPSATLPPPPSEYGDIEPVTLLVTREDALVLKYMYDMGADLDLVLRPSGYEKMVLQPQPVWLRYVIDKYQLPSTVSDLPIAPMLFDGEPRVTLTPLVTPTPVEE